MSKRIPCFAAVIVGMSLLCTNTTLGQTAKVPESIYKEGYEAVKQLFNQAVVAGDLAVCKELLEKNAVYVNETDEKGFTQLHYAAMSGQTDLCRLLLQHGAKADIATKIPAANYYTPLEAAIANDHTDTALVLINAVSPESLQPVRGRNHPPLFLAILNENVEIIKALLAKKADVNMPCLIGNFIQTPFAYAVAADNKDIAKTLLDAGADIRFEQRGVKTSDALFFAVLSRNEALCSFLIESKVDLNVQNNGRSVLHVLLGESNLYCTFQKKGIFSEGYNPSKPFTVTGPYKIAHNPELLENKKVKSPVLLCKLFIDAGTDVNVRGEDKCSVLETLFLAQIAGIHEYEDFQALLELLIASKADLNAADENGWTPLYYLLFYAFLDDQEYNEEIKEAEIKAIAEKKIGLFKMLIKAGAKVKVADKKGNTLLHYVVRSPDVEITKGANCAELIYDTRGNHRLFSRQLIELLIENGASLSDENKDGETPLDWATEGPRVGSGGYGGMGGYGGAGALGF